jgi:hypothetical protein
MPDRERRARSKRKKSRVYMTEKEKEMALVGRPHISEPLKKVQKRDNSQTQNPAVRTEENGPVPPRGLN